MGSGYFFFTARQANATIQNGQADGGGQLEVGGIFQPAAKILSQGELPIDVLLVSLAAMNTQGKPQLKRVGASRPLRADLEIIHRQASRSLRHVRGGDAESPAQHLGLRSENHSGGEGHSQPLVRIYGDRICLLNPSQ